jgi:hypothetical protein
MAALHQILSAGLTVAFSALLLVASQHFLEAQSAKSELITQKSPILVSKVSSLKAASARR